MAKEVPGTRQNLPLPGLYIYKPEMSPNTFWVSYKIAGTKRRHESLKTTNQTEAIMRADNHFQEKQSRYDLVGESGLKVKGTMRDCFNFFVENQKDEDVVKSEARAKTIISQWKRFFLVYYDADKKVSKNYPSREQLREYIIWRRGKPVGKHKKGYQPANGGRAKCGKVAQQMEAVNLTQVWKKAAEAGIISSYPRVPAPKIDVKVRARNRTVEFTTDEIPHLIDCFEDYCAEKMSDEKPDNPKYKNLRTGYNNFHQIGRERLYAFSMLLLATSARPSSLAQLRWKDIKEIKKGGESYYSFDFKHSKINLAYSAVGWTPERWNIDIGKVLARWKTFSPTYITEKKRDNARVFDIFKRDTSKKDEKNHFRGSRNGDKGNWVSFSGYSLSTYKFLKKYSLLIHPNDPDKRRKYRCTYSYRATSITERARRPELPIAFVAQQANTSIQQINASYYAHNTEAAINLIKDLPEVELAKVEPIRRRASGRQGRKAK